MTYPAEGAGGPFEKTTARASIAAGEVRMGWRWLVLGVLVAGCGASSAEEAPKPPEASSGAEVAAPAPEPSEPVAELPEFDLARRIREMVESGGDKLLLFGADVTDAGLANLSGLTSLRRLALDRTRVTDAGLVHLSGLTSLERLSLSETQVTDAGLVHLRGLTNLEYLGLNHDLFTDAGLASLRQALPNCQIDADYQIDDD